MTLEEHLKKHKKVAKGQKEQGQTRRPRRATPTPTEEDVGEAVAVA